MKTRIWIYIEVAGIASMIAGVILAAHHLQIEVPIVAGICAFYIGHYFGK